MEAKNVEIGNHGKENSIPNPTGNPIQNLIPNLAPYIRVAWYSTLEPHTVIGPRDIFDYELLYLKEGAASITVEGQCFDAVPGDVVLFRPHQRHTIRCLNDHPVIQPHVHFDLQYQDDYKDVFVSYDTADTMTDPQQALFRQDILGSFYPEIPPRIHLKKYKMFEEYLFDLIDEHDQPSYFTQVRQQWLFLRLFDLYLAEVGYTLHIGGSSHVENVAARIKMYLDKNTCRVSLDELAEVIHMDKSYLIRIFKQVYHETPLVYHQKVRIKRARSMLFYTNLSITEIAEATGFASIHDFDRVFRKVDGSAPSAYRQKL